MNFYDALSVHLAWKLRLREYVGGNTAEFLEPTQIAHEDSCELGRWIRTQGEEQKDLPEFVKMRELHAHFHRCAAEIVHSVNQGAIKTAENALNTEYMHLSAMLVKAITKINKVMVEEERSTEAA